MISLCQRGSCNSRCWHILPWLLDQKYLFWSISCHRSVTRNFCWDVLFKEMQPFPTAINQSRISWRPLIWCVHSPRSWGLVNTIILKHKIQKCFVFTYPAIYVDYSLLHDLHSTYSYQHTYIHRHYYWSCIELRIDVHWNHDGKTPNVLWMIISAHVIIYNSSNHIYN